MWNNSESDKKYYERKSNADDHRRYLLDKAKHRGKIAQEWFEAGNKLTPETLKEFKRLMKKADNDFEKVKKN